MARNRAEKLEYNRAYYRQNKVVLLEKKKARREACNAAQRRYVARNRKRVNEKKLEDYYKNRSEISRRRQKVYELNRDKKLEQRRLYIEANKDRIRETERKSYNSSAQVRIAKTIRVRINEALKLNCKSASTEELLGIDFPSFRQYLESLFESGMSWDNYSYYGWHIDHIIPLSSFDLTNPEEQKQAFHYTNTQPLWRSENQRKSAKILN